MVLTHEIGQDTHCTKHAAIWKTAVPRRDTRLPWQHIRCFSYGKSICWPSPKAKSMLLWPKIGHQIVNSASGL